MILRLKISSIFVVFWLMHIKEVCHAIDLQRYPDGVTATYAQDKCGRLGLENDPSILTKILQLHGQEFWTGVGIYTQFTPWIEILGCFNLSLPPGSVHTVSSASLCQQKCSTRFYGYKKKTRRCSCLNNEIELSNGAKLSSCEENTDDLLELVYERYNGTIKTSGEENELCTTLKCTFDHDLEMVSRGCKGNANIQGLCEDGMPSTSGKFWTLSQNQTFEHCWNKDKLVLHSQACKHFAPNLTSYAWTNVFREEIEVERIIDDTIVKPKFCISANITDKKEPVLNIYRQQCSAKLEWFVCKQNSSTVKNTYQTNEATESNYGVIVGGSVGAVIVLLIVVNVIMCKLRRVGCFKNNTSAETTNVLFTKSDNDEETSVDVKTPQHFNQSYGLVDHIKEKTNKTNDSYAQVQKVKRSEDTYAESTNGVYDHLHNIDGRKLNTSENAYDSNAGVRNRNDPTYDTATSDTGVDMDNTYDHSFTNMKTYSDYDVSDSGLQVDRPKYAAYDQAC